jgi:hypothetical protein
MHKALLARTSFIAASVIGWRRRSGKERTRQTQVSTQFAAKLSFMPCFHALLKPSVLFSSGFCWNLIPYVTKQGVPVPCFPDFTDNFIVHTSLRHDTQKLRREIHQFYIRTPPPQNSSKLFPRLTKFFVSSIDTEQAWAHPWHSV